MSCVCLHLVCQKLYHWILCANCWIKCFQTCHTYWYHWLLPFHTTFTDLDLAWGSQGQCKAKPVGLFSPALSNWSGWNLMWWWNNSSWTSWDYFLVRFIERRETSVVFLTASRRCNICMHLDDCKSIWCNLGSMIDTVVLYFLVLV